MLTNANPQPQSRMSRLRTLVTLINSSPAISLALLLCSFLKTSPAYLAPVYLAEVVRVLSAGTEADMRWFTIISAGFVLLMLVNPPLTMLTERLISGRTRNMERQLRSSVIQRLQQLSIAFYNARQSGALHAKVLNDVQSVVMLGNQLLRGGVETLIGLAVAVVIVSRNDWRILCFFLLTAPMVALILRGFSSTMRERNQSHRKDVENMSARIGEMINLIPVTRAHGVEGHEISVVEEHLANVHRSARRVDLINGWFSAWSWVTLNLFGLALVIGSGWLVFYGHMTIDRLLLFHGLYWLTIANLEKILSMTPIFTRGFDAMASLGEVLECPDLEHNRGRLRLEHVRGEVTFDQVTFRYQEAHDLAVDAFSLQVHAGECVALVGQSGSGKSTLMNLMIGFWRPQSGEILLDGYPQSELDMRAWRQHVAVVPQHTVLFSGSLRDNIVYGRPDVSDADVERSIEAANLAALVKKLPEGLATQLGENGLSLSGGQRQRVAIARAIVRNPRVIVFDEATSALDVASEREVQRAIDNLIGGRTTFIIAHRLSTIRRADRVVVMRDGRCIETGPREALLNDGSSVLAAMEAM